MEIQVKPNPTKVATKWALINLAAAIVVTYIIQFTNMDPQSPARYLPWIPFIAFLLLTQKEFRDQLGGYMSFGNGFSAGFRYSLFTGILVSIFSGIYFFILSPAAWTKIVDSTIAKLQAQNAPDSAIEQTNKIMNSGWSIVGACFVAAVMYAIVGAILSLIGAAILKKELSPLEAAERAQDPTV